MLSASGNEAVGIFLDASSNVCPLLSWRQCTVVLVGDGDGVREVHRCDEATSGEGREYSNDLGHELGKGSGVLGRPNQLSFLGGVLFPTLAVRVERALGVLSKANACFWDRKDRTSSASSFPKNPKPARERSSKIMTILKLKS